MPIDTRPPLPREFPEWWSDLLQEWGRLMDDYCNYYPDDAPYWYGERTLTGVLAAAAWKLHNGWSLLEFEVPRVEGEEEPSSGRGDAWIGRGEWFSSLECKCAWVYTPELESAIRKVEENLRDAGAQLMTLPEDYRGNLQLAVCYLVPGVAERKPDTTGVQSLFRGLTTHFQRRALVAIYHPPGDSLSRKDKNYWYPGVALVAEPFTVVS